MVRIRAGAVQATIAVIWLLGAAVIIGIGPPPPSTVVVVHWANGHVMTPALLESFARTFNGEDHRSASGKRIEVQPVLVNSSVIAEGLIARIKPGAVSIECEATGCVDPRNLPDPTVVTPAADHWLSQLNYEVGRSVINLNGTQSMAAARIGIATLGKMAACLGWPEKEVGLGDVLALRADPRGWETCTDAEARWGRKPLVAFTDPHSSSTGRSLLYGLFAIAANKAPAALTDADVSNTTVREYMRRFQGEIDLYAPDTLVLNRQIYSTPRSAHFFFIAEDNLVQLYEGKAARNDPATPPNGLRADQNLVMIYPREGSPLHTHPVAIVQAEWVTEEQAEAARVWARFLREGPQQRAFLAEGLRPVADVAVGCPICPLYGLDPQPRNPVIDPNEIDPSVRQAIARSWGDVRTPGVLALVVDNSTTMAGTNLDRAREGLIHLIDRIDKRTNVGLISFADGVQQPVPVAPLTENRFQLREAIDRMQARGGSNLYGAIKEGIGIADRAPAEDGAVRGVLVLSSGRASSGTRLDELIALSRKTDGTSIAACRGFATDAPCEDEAGGRAYLADVNADGLAFATENRVVHFFCAAIGGRVDPQVGRLLAAATKGSDCQTELDTELNNVVNRFGRYF
jgi:Ca-activated chloride channel family protein